MNAKSMRALLVDADPSVGDELRPLLEQFPNVEIVGIAHSQRAAANQVESTQPPSDTTYQRW